jgi:gluconokinase
VAVRLGIRPTTVVVMGVAGSGKSSVGRLIADLTGWPFVDADDLHPPENIARMRAGIGLTDTERWPWLRAVAAWISRTSVGDGDPSRGGTRTGGVVACSALKRAYRDLLRTADPQLRLVYLRTEVETLRERLADRPGHFFPAALLDAQLADLEEPAAEENPITIPIGLSAEESAHAALAGLVVDEAG